MKVFNITDAFDYLRFNFKTQANDLEKREIRSHNKVR